MDINAQNKEKYLEDLKNWLCEIESARPRSSPSGDTSRTNPFFGIPASASACRNTKHA